jgi:DNA-binding MarR family transcriptional regulator
VGNDAPGVDEMQAAATPDEIGPDAIGIIELELMKLVRHLDTFGRRSSLYVRVDRAGYLAMRMLDSLGPVPVNALAQSLSLDSSTVTRQVTALAAQGLV